MGFQASKLIYIVHVVFFWAADTWRGIIALLL